MSHFLTCTFKLVLIIITFAILFSQMLMQMEVRKLQHPLVWHTVVKNMSATHVQGHIVKCPSQNMETSAYSYTLKNV